MPRSTRSLLLMILLSGLYGIQPSLASPLQAGNAQPQIAPETSPPTLVVPAGSKVVVALIRPVWARTAKAGDPLYLQTIFPVVTGKYVAIPAGTYVAGVIDSVVSPTRTTNQARIGVHFTRITFANGYTIMLPGQGSGGVSRTAVGPNPNLGATRSLVTVQVSRNNDLLLDNGSQIEMTLDAPLTLDPSRVAQAIPLSQAPKPGAFRSATLCRPDPGSPGSPGTPDTVIPGTPGTPPTVIPSGIPGVPDTVIPGTPATPPTVIPGIPDTPSTPGTACPAPPLVVSSTPVTVKQNTSAPPAVKQ